MYKIRAHHLILPLLLILFSCKRKERTKEEKGWSKAKGTKTLKTTSVELKAYDLPAEIFEMKLETLSVTGPPCDYHQGPPCYALLKIPNNVEKLNTLHSLSLRNNAIKEIPVNIKYLDNLEVLDLSHNPLENAGNLSLLTNLKELYLYSCGLKHVPPGIEHLTNLKTLALGDNPIPQEEILKLSKELPECRILL